RLTGPLSRPLLVWQRICVGPDIVMVKGLLYRQAFTAAQVVLVALFALTVLALVREILRGSPPSALSGVMPPDPSALESQLPTVRSRTAYSVIPDSGLFGEAGRFDPGAKPVEPITQAPPQAEEPETKLALKLKGTTFTEPRDPRASAIIEVREKGNEI